MSNVIVIGTQWGDEGKGKIVDWLSEKADLVFDTFHFIRNILMLLLVRVFISRSLMSLVKC